MMETAPCLQEPSRAGEQTGVQPALVTGRQTRLLHGYLHKTSNSLCGIKGYAGLIAAADPDEQLARYAARILAEVERMEQIYASVQEMAFPNHQKVSGEDLTVVLALAANRCRQRYPQLCIELATRSTGPLLLPARDLEMAVQEILCNSAEGRSTKPATVPLRVRFSIQPSGADRLALRIEDNGPGMIPELAAKAADPFVTTKAGHLGIGLARVDTVMDMYGLAWSIASDDGGGTSVVMEVADIPPAVTASTLNGRINERW
ncbi:MAG: HAMP domain-containing sensor histidine kinase [bacterium]